MMKRRLGSSLSGRTYWSRRRDLMLTVLTHDIMILLPFQLIQQIKVFYTALLSDLLGNCLRSAPDLQHHDRCDLVGGFGR